MFVLVCVLRFFLPLCSYYNVENNIPACIRVYSRSEAGIRWQSNECKKFTKRGNTTRIHTSNEFNHNNNNRRGIIRILWTSNSLARSDRTSISSNSYSKLFFCGKWRHSTTLAKNPTDCSNPCIRIVICTTKNYDSWEDSETFDRKLRKKKQQQTRRLKLKRITKKKFYLLN